MLPRASQGVHLDKGVLLLRTGLRTGVVQT